MENTQMELLTQHIERLQKENQEHKADIEMTVQYIARLLTDLGILTPDYQFQFSMKQLVRSVMPILTNPAKAQDKFAYLADLRHIIEKYAPAAKNKLSNHL